MAEFKNAVLLQTSCGAVCGLDLPRCRAFLGVPFARAERFAYAQTVDTWEGVLDATHPGPACPQNRALHEHLEHPTRRFYQREFREGSTFTYDEDCLNLNIYAPLDAQNAPVVLFFYGGGFDSGLNCEDPFNGSALAARGVLTVFANYRVGVLGYLTHADIQAAYGRDGNFGLDDQLTAIRWVRAHIRDFGGDPDNITLMGQSAGAISAEYLSLNPAHAGLYQRAVLMSGAGLFPAFARPKPAAETHAYWLQFMELAGCKTLEELKAAPLETLFNAVEAIKAVRKDNLYNTMPVMDGVLLPEGVDKLIRHPLPIDYMIGYTNADMFAPVLARIGNELGRRTQAYMYYFDLNAPGDDNRAFHSSDVRYMFGTLDSSWRPYGPRDHEASAQMMDYLANFARCGDPNGEGLPTWEKAGNGLRTQVLCIAPEGTRMGHADYGTLTRNFLHRGDPIAE